MDSKELFNEVKHDEVKFTEVNNKQNEFLDKLSNKKIGRKTVKQKKWLIILKDFAFLEQKL